MSAGKSSGPDWEARYAGEDAPFGDQPSEYLRMVLARGDAPQSGKALFLADGDGRNGSWAAARGFRVTAVDISRTATGKAIARDMKALTSARRVIGDLTEWHPAEDERFDLIAMLYLQGPAELRTAPLAWITDALAPGGWFLLEGFAKTGPERPAMGPGDDALRWGLEEVLPLLKGCEILEAFDGTALLADGALHTGPARILRLLIRKA